MKIKSITLYNFRQYYGKVEIEFSIDKEKNVTVLVGDNGTGKTTLLQAFIYCLYGKDYIKLGKDEELLNFKVLKETKGNAHVYVEVVFTHGNKEYKVRRSRDYYEAPNSEKGYAYDKDEFSGYVKDNKGSGKVIEQQIKAIIPTQLMDLFFFDGERMERLADVKNKRNLSDTVVNMLGLNSYEESLKLLKSNSKHSVENLIRSEIKVVSHEINRISNKRDKFIERLDIIEKDIQNKYKERELLTEKEEYYAKVLKEFEPSKNAQEQREKLEMTKKILEDSLDKQKKEIFKYFFEIAPYLLINNVLDEVKEILDKTELSDKGIEGMTSIAIDHLIKMGKCLCGSKIEFDNEVYNELIKWKQYLPPQNISNLLVELNNNIETSNYMIETESLKIIEEYQNILKQRLRIRNIEQEINSLSVKIYNIDVIREYEEKYRVTKKKLHSVINDIGGLEFEKNTIEEEINKHNKELYELFKQDEKNKIINKKIKFIDEIYAYIENEFKNKVEEARKILQDHASQIYRKLLNEQYHIILNENYSFEVLDANNINITEIISEGEKVVSSFAFVGALIQTAIELNKSINEDEDYPLVMDAPFAKLDNSHRANVGKTIPELANQLLIFTIDSQWEGAVENNMLNRVGKKYYLFKDDIEHVTRVEEVL